MYNNSIDPGDVLLNRGLNGLYGYGGAGNFLGDGSAVKESVRGNRDIQLLQGVNQNARDGFLSAQIERGDSSISNLVNMENQSTRDLINLQSLDRQFATLERIISANQADTQRDLNAIRNDLTECCCKLEAGQASILAKLDAQALMNAQNENVTLRNQITIMQAQSQGN